MKWKSLEVQDFHSILERINKRPQILQTFKFSTLNFTLSNLIRSISFVEKCQFHQENIHGAYYRINFRQYVCKNSQFKFLMTNPSKVIIYLDNGLKTNFNYNYVLYTYIGHNRHSIGILCLLQHIMCQLYIQSTQHTSIVTKSLNYIHIRHACVAIYFSPIWHLYATMMYSVCPYGIHTRFTITIQILNILM